MSKAIEQSKIWLQNMVIGLNLCPFAKKPFVADTIRYVVFKENDLDKLGQLLAAEFMYLDKVAADEAATTLIIIENTLEHFYDYLDFLEVANSILVALDFEGVFQIASFHPKYQFAGTAIDAPENYTNRSPYPILHILREESLSDALENYPNPEAIPEKNIATLQQLGLTKIKAILEK